MNSHRSRASLPALPRPVLSESDADKQVSRLVMRLLSHYWTAAEPLESRLMQAEDWLEDLAEFPLEAVAEACRRWRRSESRRPTIADIRKLAAEETRETRKADPAPPLRHYPDARLWGPPDLTDPVLEPYRAYQRRFERVGTMETVGETPSGWKSLADSLKNIS